MTDRDGAPASGPQTGVGPLTSFLWTVIFLMLLLALLIAMVFFAAAWVHLLVDAAQAGWEWSDA